MHRNIKVTLNVKAVGQSHAAAVNGNGEVYLWGNNKDTQVCPKKIALVPKPMKVTGLNTVSIKQVFIFITYFTEVA
jgi:alpha-tubulin suppressor-like RCC1 family protein